MKRLCNKVNYKDTIKLTIRILSLALLIPKAFLSSGIHYTGRFLDSNVKNMLQTTCAVTVFSNNVQQGPCGKHWHFRLWGEQGARAT